MVFAMAAPLEIPTTPDRVVRLRTRWSDEDSQGVLNNAVSLTLFEEARRALFDELELFDADGNFPFLLASTRADFRSPGRGGVEVDVEISTTHLGRSSFTQAYRIRSLEGVAWTEGTATLVCYDPETRESRPMTDGFRTQLAASCLHATES